MTVAIQLRGDTAANWSSANPVLAERELGFDTDTLLYKIGDGVTAWNALPFRELTGAFESALEMAVVPNPGAPDPGNMRLYAYSFAGRALPKVVGPSGLDTGLQPAMFGNGLVMVSPGGSTAFSVLGTSAPTSVGTVSHPAIISGGSLRQSTRRGIVTSAATANSAAASRIAAALCYRGESIGGVDVGGFFFSGRVAWSSTTALQRGFVGLLGSTGAVATTQAPSALTNCLLLGWDSSDANMSIMHNDASGAATKIDLGADFSATDPNAVYDVQFFCKPSGEEVGYRVLRLDDPAMAEGVLTTDLPAKSTLLTWHAYANNGGTAAAVVIEIMRAYLETDY